MHPSGIAQHKVSLYYSWFQVTFQSAIATFVLNIPSYINKFGILHGNLLSQICKLLN